MDANLRGLWLQAQAEGDPWGRTAGAGQTRASHEINPNPRQHPACAERLVGLANVIEAEIIPRLLLAHGARAKAGGASIAMAWVPLPGAVREFTEIVLGVDVGAALAYVERIKRQGASIESLCLELLAPTARRLGQLWESDDRDIAEVTLGLLRLHHVLREFAPPPAAAETARDAHSLRALLVPAPGEDHRLGIAMVVEFFRRAGWVVEGNAPESLDDLRAVVRAQWFDVVGLSVSSTSRLGILSAGIRAVREASSNRDVVVMVGGQVFTNQPDLGVALEADATVIDGLLAPGEARELLARRGRSRRA